MYIIFWAIIAASILVDWTYIQYPNITTVVKNDIITDINCSFPGLCIVAPNDDFDIDVLLSDSALYKDDLYNLLTQLYSSTSDWARDYIQIHPKQHKQYVDMVNTGKLNLKDISLKYGI